MARESKDSPGRRGETRRADLISGLRRFKYRTNLRIFLPLAGLASAVRSTGVWGPL